MIGAHRSPPLRFGSDDEYGVPGSLTATIIVDGRHRALTVFSLGLRGYDPGRTVIAGTPYRACYRTRACLLVKLFEPRPWSGA